MTIESTIENLYLNLEKLQSQIKALEQDLHFHQDDRSTRLEIVALRRLNKFWGTQLQLTAKNQKGCDLADLTDKRPIYVECKHTTTKGGSYSLSSGSPSFFDYVASRAPDVKNTWLSFIHANEDDQIIEHFVGPIVLLSARPDKKNISPNILRKLGFEEVAV